MNKVFLRVLIGLVIISLVILGFLIKNMGDDAEVAVNSSENTAVATDSGKVADMSGEKTVDATNPSDGLDESSTGNSKKKSEDKSSQALSDKSDKNTQKASEEKTEEEKKNKNIVEKILPDKVENKIEAIAEGDVSASDLLEVIKIVGKKLSLKEITFLFNSAKSEYWETTSVEDIEKARDILFDKLSDEDLAKLSEFGKKYGRSMTIIQKDIDVAEEKEKLMRKKGLID